MTENSAFMVHPQWQGCGLGTILQQRMTEHALTRGVRGFVAEILASNPNMIRPARGGAANVNIETTSDSARVTALF